MSWHEVHANAIGDVAREGDSQFFDTSTSPFSNIPTSPLTAAHRFQCSSIYPIPGTQTYYNYYTIVYSLHSISLTLSLIFPYHSHARDNHRTIISINQQYVINKINCSPRLCCILDCGCIQPCISQCQNYHVPRCEQTQVTP